MLVQHRGKRPVVHDSPPSGAPAAVPGGDVHVGGTVYGDRVL